jgi:uncharacterized repeat protein (TIGR03803 family)
MTRLSSCLLGVLVSCVAGGAHAAGQQPATETVVYSFQNNGTDGNNPYAGLIASDGLLYGTTENGGTGNCGTLFSFDPATGKETVLSVFPAGGCHPEAPLIKVRNVLYGTTFQGGHDADGVVFAYNLSTGAQTVLHSFQNNGSDGVWPAAALLYVNGLLYGTTWVGGAYNYGTVFSINSHNRAENVVYSFCQLSYCGDGANPLAALIQVGNLLYGTTETGGGGTGGTVFSFDPATGVHNVIHYCGAADNPVAPLINVGGELYGTTWGGGSLYQGQVFKIEPNGQRFETIYSFTPSAYDAYHPYGAVLYANGTLYGTTQSGGSLSCGRGGCGAVYAINLKTGAERKLHAFKGKPDGQSPYGALIEVGGVLYGTTYSGGSDNEGTVFKVVLN